MNNKVLYAEDEFTNRKLLEIQLKNNGIQCDLAEDGMEAIRMFQAESYDLVILDQFMPGMNGDETAVLIRNIDPDIPLIAITSDDGEIPVLRRAGFQEIFIKPLRGKDHIDIIKKYLARKRDVLDEK